MLTPPYHFSIVTVPSLLNPSTNAEHEILYRGSLPAQRNLSFVRRLRLKTIVVLRKKALKEDDPFIVWAKKRGVDVRWIKAEEMGEEKLGMGKNEVGEVLKIILNPSSYPLYIADVDGISHTTLVVACLRKLQGWHIDCIIDEICRFEPDHEDLPLVSFITSYLSPSSSSSSAASTSSSDPPFTLPPPPFPTWLWPTLPSSRPPVQSRDRSTSSSGSSAPSLLPFPHPLNTRRHPTMRLTFPTLPTPPSASSPILSPTSQQHNPLSRTPSRRDKFPTLPSPHISSANGPSGTVDDIAGGGLLGSAANIVTAGLTGMANVLVGINAEEEKERERAIAKDNNKMGDGSNRLGRQVSFHGDHERNQGRSQAQTQASGGVSSTLGGISTTTERDIAGVGAGPSSTTSSSSPVKLSREPTISSSDYTAEDGSVSPSTSTDGEDDGDGEEDDYDEDEDEDYDDDENDDDDEDIQPTSQYISALDLAGFG
ncbi:hypothetical protein CI109_101749 [Kwoniella shandongensis]|uniref:Putative tyrosine-protein phosphatase OCA1 n=1 Tax=Kwoniella shandongensis TaxID=1734106 RepID=A0A5M6C5C5_9TREE|nr:uncharacterized protein CI109_001129 [Kwoniella shandongensis]KAA5530328.1 hypothetical protein CI109_001129 [Kwoniella shandongensis]